MARQFRLLTRPAIRALKPGDKITENGITASKLGDGDVRYSINVMVDGQRIHRVIGLENDGTTRTQAEEFITKVRSDAKAGRLQLPKGRKLPLTFTAAAANYLAGEREVDAKDIASKERHLRLHLVPYFGHMRVDGTGEDAITEFAVEKFRSEFRRQGMAEGGINRVIATYRHMGRKLISRRVLEKPLPMVKLKKVEDRRDFIFSLGQERAMLDAALRDSSAYVWLFIKIGLSTSLRHSEILSARFDGLDTQRRRLRVKAKGGYWRDQPLSQDMVDILVRERDMAEDRDGWIFPSPKSLSGHVFSMKKAFRRCVVRAGLDPERATPHTMRHTAITNLAETGADVRTIQQFSGHKSPTMPLHYTHAREERVNRAVEQMEQAKTKPERIGRREAEDS